MSKILAGLSALALVAVLALPSPVNGAERRAAGLRNDAATPTEFSAQYRRWRYGYYQPYWRRYGYYRPYWRPRYAYYPYYRPYWRPWYGGYPYYPSYRPWYRPYPVVSIGFGFGPRWWW